MLNKYRSYSSFDLNQVLRNEYKSPRKPNKPDSSVLSNESGLGSLYPTYSAKLLNTTYNSTSHLDTNLKDAVLDLTTISTKSTASNRNNNSQSKNSTIESQYQRQFERVVLKKPADLNCNLNKFHYNPEKVNYRNIQRPPQAPNPHDFADKPNDSDKNNNDDNTSDDDTIKSVFSDNQSIKTEEFSNVFNNYVALTNTNLEMHDIQYT